VRGLFRNLFPDGPLESEGNDLVGESSGFNSLGDAAKQAAEHMSAEAEKEVRVRAVCRVEGHCRVRNAIAYYFTAPPGNCGGRRLVCRTDVLCGRTGRTSLSVNGTRLFTGVRLVSAQGPVFTEGIARATSNSLLEPSLFPIIIRQRSDREEREDGDD
jgi:hypothetical protein